MQNVVKLRQMPAVKRHDHREPFINGVIETPQIAKVIGSDHARPSMQPVSMSPDEIQCEARALLRFVAGGGSPDAVLAAAVSLAAVVSLAEEAEKKGARKPTKEQLAAADAFGIEEATFRSRIAKGWDVKKALLTPVRKYAPSRHQDALTVVLTAIDGGRKIEVINEVYELTDLDLMGPKTWSSARQGPS
jgi:ribosomal protein L7/L12